MLATPLVEEGVEPSRGALKTRATAHGILSQELLANSPELDLEVTLRMAGTVTPPSVRSSPR